MVPITGLYAGLFGLIVLALSFRVSMIRKNNKVGLGTGDNAKVQLAMRAHGNAIEYIPILLIMLATYELNGGISSIAHGFGIALIVVRLAHAIGFSEGTSLGRYWGAVGTYLLLGVMAVFNLIGFFMRG